MKIHSPHPSDRGQMQIGRHAYRLLALCSVVAVGVTACTSASAQSGVLDQLNGSSATRGEFHSAVRNGLFTHGNDNYQVVSTAAFRTAADIGQTEPGAVAQVGYGCRTGGNSCGRSCGDACGGSCGSCGPYGGRYGGGYGGLAGPCAPCQPYYYATFEALAMDLNSNPDYRATNNARLGNFDYEFGGRATVGGVPDCVHGWEVGFTGRFDWDRGFLIRDPNGGLGTLLRPFGPVAAANLSAFQNATDKSLAYQARYWSVEANSTMVGWEIAKLLFGVRYINYDERLLYLSRNLVGEEGLLLSQVENQLVGPQIGMDLLYPISANGYADFRSRAGVFVNFAEGDLAVINNGSTIAAAFQDRERIAGAFEIGSGLRYQLGEMLAVRAGVEFWYLTQVATAPRQFRNVVGLRRRLSLKDDIFMVGVSLGAEFKY